MAICRFWVKGDCRNGSSCRFEHPQQKSQPQNQVQNNHSSAQFQGNSRNGAHQTNFALPFMLDKGSIITDLTSERPQWILSAYGPGRQAPGQLFGGSVREQSFEEMRLKHYIAAASGNPQQAIHEANLLFQNSEQQIQAVLNNVDGAIKFIVDSESDVPNRYQICQNSSLAPGGYNPNPLSTISTNSVSTSGGVAQSTNSAFGQPTQSSGTFGQSSQTSGAFGQPSQPTGVFGQHSQASTGAFRQPGQSTTSVFGQPSQPVSAFGKPSQTSIGAFGQPSALGAKPSPFSAPAFGTAAQPGAAGTFGQPSGLGQKPNPWGAPANSAPSTIAGFSSHASQPTAFGQPSQSNAFGQASQPAQVNPFGQPSQSSRPSPFSQTTQSSAFGQSQQTSGLNPAAPQSSAFGQPTEQNVPYTTTNQTPNASIPAPALFGVPSAPNNPFSTGNAQVMPNANPFAPTPQPSQASPFEQSSQQSKPNLIEIPQAESNVNGILESSSGFPEQRPLTAYASVTPDRKLIMFKGKQVNYKGDEPWMMLNDKYLQRIWCPKGAPSSDETQADAIKYTPEVEATYSQLRQTGEFPGSVIPMIPPKVQWSSYEI